MQIKIYLFSKYTSCFFYQVSLFKGLMLMSIERILTLVLIALGVLFLFVLMPAQVETVDSGRIVPSTVPTIALSIIIVMAFIQLFIQQTTIVIDRPIIIRSALFITLLIITVWAMEQFGFEYVASPLAFAVMLLIGEKRWHWLLIGGLITPIGIWLLVEQVLGRTLA